VGSAQRLYNAILVIFWRQFQISSNGGEFQMRSEQEILSLRTIKEEEQDKAVEEQLSKK
jgi:hypothetical protein